MKAVRYSQFGGPEVLKIVDLPDPHAGPGQIRVAVHAAGANPTDWKLRKGLMGGAPADLAQGALAWLWARSAVTIPIPGFRTVAQAEENAHAMAFGPLSDQQVREVDALLHQQART